MAPTHQSTASSAGSQRTLRPGRKSVEHRPVRKARTAHDDTGLREEEMDTDDDVLIDSTDVPASGNIEMTALDEDSDMIGASVSTRKEEATLNFAPLPDSAQVSSMQTESRQIAIPPHRYTPLKKDWMNIYSPLTEILGLQVRMNLRRRAVELRVSEISYFSVNAYYPSPDFKAYEGDRRNSKRG